MDSVVSDLILTQFALVLKIENEIIYDCTRKKTDGFFHIDPLILLLLHQMRPIPTIEFIRHSMKYTHQSMYMDLYHILDIEKEVLSK